MVLVGGGVGGEVSMRIGIHTARPAVSAASVGALRAARAAVIFVSSSRRRRARRRSSGEVVGAGGALGRVGVLFDADADVDAAGADAEAEARSDFLGTFCAVEPLVVLEIFGFLAGGLDVDVDAVAEVRDWRQLDIEDFRTHQKLRDVSSIVE